VAHEILGKRFGQVEGRRPAWHGIQGATFAVGTSATAAAEAIGALYEVSKEQAYVQVDGVWTPIPDQYALVRPDFGGSEAGDAGRVMPQVVSGSYELIQHRDFASILDPLSERWQVETAGVLSNGGQLFFCFAAGQYVVNQDAIKLYWIASDFKNGRAARLFSAHTRVVCNNTFIIAESGAIASLKFPHTRGVAAELEFAVAALAAAEAQQAQVAAQLEAMGRHPLTTQELHTLLAATYPMPQAPRRVRTVEALERGRAFLAEHAPLAAYSADIARLDEVHAHNRQRVEELRAATLERYHVFGAERSDYRDTAWAAWNAITEVSNHRQGRNAATEGEMVLFGYRGDEMRRAWRELTSLAGC
jgi:hypothetical protein